MRVEDGELVVEVEADHADLVRCWQTTDPDYNRYHDEEWGRPVRDERGIYERLCLEGFQSGLSWLTILRKRPAFREAFADFDPDRVALYDERDVERLLGDAGSCATAGRSRRRSRTPGRRWRCARPAEPLHELVWATRPRSTGAAWPRRLAGHDARVGRAREAAARRRVPVRRPDDRVRGMQACGVVNDHLADCWVRDAVESGSGSPDARRPRPGRPSPARGGDRS